MDLSLRRLRLLPRATKRLNRKIEDRGLVEAMRRLIAKTGTKVEIYGKTKNIAKILKNDPVLILANHPNEADIVIILAAIEPRGDLYFVGNVLLQGILSSMDKSLLPVYLPNKRHGQFNRIKMKFINRIHNVPTLEDKERHEKNIETINRASEIITKGGGVAIFPGAGGKCDSWFAGVGYLIGGIKNKNTKIVMAYIENTSDLDYLRLIPGVSRLLRTIKVTFFKPIELSKIKKTDPKILANTLHDIYYKQIKLAMK